MSKLSIFSHTFSEYGDEVAKRLGRGKVIAGELYRQWFKKGKIFQDAPAFLQAKNLVQSIISETDFHLPNIILKTAVGDAKSAQSFESESLAIGGAFPTWECSPSIASDSDSKSCTALASPTAVFRIIQNSACDETYKFLLRTHDGYDVESVRIPMKSQETLCVSSQVGCRMGCAFCETGRMGLLRNLTSSEIVSQVFVARFMLNFTIRNVVFMGMGEPFDNYDEVSQAIKVLSDQNGLAIGMHRITVSTSGKIEGILRLADEKEISPNLAVSINAPNDALRTKLMPHNRKENLALIRDAIEFYCRKKSRQVLVAYVLMKGINDTLAHADELMAYLEGLDVKVNLIPYNVQSVDRFQTPEPEVIDAFAAHLRENSFRVLLRRTKGHSIMAACGQLGNPSLKIKKII